MIIEPILVELEGGRYIVLILPYFLTDLVVGRRPEVGSAPKSGDGGI